jgi:RHS repeat-associated protein
MDFLSLRDSFRPHHEAGLNSSYNIFRWYRAGWGRYTQADPLGIEGDPHPYPYALNNPVRFIDLLGLSVEVCCRPVQFYQGKFRCFIRTDGAGPGSYSLFPDSLIDLVSGLGAFGIPTRDDPSDLNASTPHCRSTPDCGDIRRCIEDVFNQYPKGKYKFSGPKQQHVCCDRRESLRFEGARCGKPQGFARLVIKAAKDLK